MMNKKYFLSWHKKLGWLAGIALCVFAFSGILHPLMVWTGPKAKAFFPPQTKVAAQELYSVSEILTSQGISRAEMVKVLASEKGALLQVTNEQGADRQYFDLNSKEHIKGHDREQAKWLAGLYSGLPENQIESVVFKTSFDSEYPWVNRLLPVYKVQYNTEDNLTLYVFTETNALASISNDWKAGVQSLFGALHTWSWLKELENFRLVVMSLFVLAVLGLAASGTALVFLIKKRKIKDSDRSWHRKLAANLLWLPLLGFSASGLYHLLQSGLSEPARGIKISQEMNLSDLPVFDQENWQYQSVRLNGLSLIQLQGGELAYRLSLPTAKSDEVLTAQQRFDGTPIEKGAIYLNAESGAEVDISDQTRSENLARRILSLNHGEPLESSVVTHFNANYDFRNKRLPVWEVVVLGSDIGRVYIDPANDVLIDQLADSQRYEGYSFSILHKWHFLKPITGRLIRDIIMSVLMVLVLIFSFLGFRLKYKSVKRNKRIDASTVNPMRTIGEA